MVSRGYGKRTRGVKVDLVFEKIKAENCYRLQVRGLWHCRSKHNDLRFSCLIVIK